ncbi:MAG: 50S ribosomal protein L3, partial [Candidatus Neomarinimicrobiota bacterium]|nr:50S ribosomal protein L3 [Candidatus Neomarinimicrobiota bacterium]
SDGYSSVQLAFGEKSKRNTNKPLKGHLKKAKIDSAKVLAEFQSVDGFDYELGQKFDSSIFNIGEMVNVRSKSKGKGFAGVIKRHGFSTQPATHGTKHTERAGGSIGQASWPSRVFKGLKMPGRLGNAYTTAENLEIVNIDKERNLLYVKGAVAGANNAIVFILKK